MGRIHEYVRPHYTKFVDDVDPTQLVDRLVNYITKRDKDVILTETRNYGSAAGAGKLLAVIDGKVYEAELVEALEACGYLELAALLQGRQPPATAAGAPRPGPPPPHPPPFGPQSPPPSTSGAVNVTITNMSTGTIAIQHAEPGGTNKFVVEAVPSGSGIEANDSEEAAGTEEEYEVCVQETSPGSQPHTSQAASCTSSSSPGSEQLYSRYVDEHRERTVRSATGGLYQQDQVANGPASKPLEQSAGQPADTGHQQGQLFNPGRQDSSPLKSHQQTDGKESSPPEHRSRRIGQQVSHTSSQGSPRLDGDDPLQTLGVEFRRKSAMSPQTSGNVQDTGIETGVKVPFVPGIETAPGAASETGNFHRQSMSSSSAPDDVLDLRSTASLREMNNARSNVPSRGRVGGQRVPERVPLDSNVSSLMINSEEFRTRSDHQPASSTADHRDQELPPDNPQHHPLLPVMVEEMEVSGIDSLVNVDGESSLLSLERCSAGENTRLKSNSPDMPTTDSGDVDAHTSSHDEDEDTSSTSTLVSSDNSDAAYSNGIDDSLVRCTSGARECGKSTMSSSPDLSMAATDASEAGDHDRLQSEASSSSPLVPNGVENHANGLSTEMSNHVDVRLLPGSATATEHRETDDAVNSWWRRGWQSLGELINSG